MATAAAAEPSTGLDFLVVGVDDGKEGDDATTAAAPPSNSKLSSQTPPLPPSSNAALSPEAQLAALPPIRTSPLSWLTLSWLDRLVWRGYRRPLRFDDLLSMRAHDRASALAYLLRPFRDRVTGYLHLQAAATAAAAAPTVTPATSTSDVEEQPSSQPQKPSEGPTSTSPAAPSETAAAGASRLPKPSLLGALLSRFALIWAVSGVLYAASVGAQMVVPTFLQQLLYSLAGDEYSRSQLFMPSAKATAAVIFALQLCTSLFGRSNDQIMRTMSVNTRTALIGQVYEKSLRLSGKSSQEFTQGRILNLVNVDIENIVMFVQQSQILWVTPIQVVVAIVLLHNLIGNAVFVSFGAMIGSMLIQAAMFGLLATHQKRMLKSGDDRLKAIRESLYAIRTIKLHAWEYVFKGRIAKLRDQQVGHLRNFNVVIVFAVSIAQVTPILMPIVGFIVYTRLNSPTGIPSATTVFPALTFYNLLIDPLFQLPSVATDFVQAIVSFRRLSEFLLAEETDPLQIEEVDRTVPVTERPKAAIQIEDATFKWEAVKLAVGSEDTTNEDDKKDEKATSKKRQLFKPSKASEEETAPPQEIRPLFQGLNLAIPRGKLTCIVGPVGSGKSSLLSAIIGEMTLVPTEASGGRVGSVHVRGRVAYAPQQPWILTDTVEGNVAFAGGHETEESEEHRRRRLNRAMDVAMLGPDLAGLSKGSLTLIGEKGVNLSGGQQARVALARAVFEDGDIYLLDDPLSALDAHVGKAVFERCIKGALAHKTRVLVTHQLHVLPSADLVVVLDEGRIVEAGSFADLMAKGPDGALVGMMEHHLIEEAAPRRAAAASSRKGSSTSTATSASSRRGSVIIADSANVSDDVGDGKNGADGDRDILEEEDRATGGMKGSLWLGFYRAAGGLPVALTVVVAALVQQTSSVLNGLWLSWWSADQFDLSGQRYIDIYGALGGAQIVSL
ncbi:Canalicular multispecific organic anion transporter 1, partial [Cladochytrium tenue]